MRRSLWMLLPLLTSPYKGEGKCGPPYKGEEPRRLRQAVEWGCLFFPSFVRRAVGVEVKNWRKLHGAHTRA